MSDLLRDTYPGNENWRSTRALMDEIRWSMAPFAVSDIIVTVDTDWSIGKFQAWMVDIKVKSLPGFSFRHTINPDELSAMYHPEHLAQAVGREAGKYFRSVRVEPESNIQLGEN